MNALRRSSLAAASMLVIGLAACNRSAPELAASDAPASSAAPAEPAPAPLPAAEAQAPVAPAPAQTVIVKAPAIRDAYAFDRRMSAGGGVAWEFNGDRYWRGPDGALRVVRRNADGERIYYYRPGARDPYLVRQGGAFFTFRAGGLKLAFDSNGRPVSLTADIRQRRARSFIDDARSAHDRADTDWRQRSIQDRNPTNGRNDRAGQSDHTGPDRAAAPGDGRAMGRNDRARRDRGAHDAPAGSPPPANHAGTPAQPEHVSDKSKRARPDCNVPRGQRLPKGCPPPKPSH